jgi:hypothetical protein
VRFPPRSCAWRNGKSPRLVGQHTWRMFRRRAVRRRPLDRPLDRRTGPLQRTSPQFPTRLRDFRRGDQNGYADSSRHAALPDFGAGHLNIPDMGYVSAVESVNGTRDRSCGWCGCWTGTTDASTVSIPLKHRASGVERTWELCPPCAFVPDSSVASRQLWRAWRLADARTLR